VDRYRPRRICLRRNRRRPPELAMLLGSTAWSC